MALSQEAQARIGVLREKARNNTITQDEMREAIQMMRQDRVGAATASAGAKERKATASKKKAPVNSDDLLSELDGL